MVPEVNTIEPVRESTDFIESELSKQINYNNGVIFLPVS